MKKEKSSRTTFTLVTPSPTDSTYGKQQAAVICVNPDQIQDGSNQIAHYSPAFVPKDDWECPLRNQQQVVREESTLNQIGVCAHLGVRAASSVLIGMANALQG